MQEPTKIMEAKFDKNIINSSAEQLEILKNQLRFLLESSDNTELKTVGDIKHFLIVQNKNLGKLVKILLEMLCNTLSNVPPVLYEVKKMVEKSK